MEHQAIGWNTGSEGNVHLAAGSDVEVHAFFVRESCHRCTHEGFGGVGDSIRKASNRFAAASPQMGLVVDKQRCPVLGCQIDDVTVSDSQPTVC